MLPAESGVKITALRIENFRAIEDLEMDGLGDFVVIAGANGCGKTTVLDALRLVKSLYVKDEWRQWFGEFAVDAQHATNMASLFRDSTKPARILASIQLDEEELSFVAQHSDNIFQTILLNERGDSNQPVTGDAPLLPPSLDPAELERIVARAAELSAELATGMLANAGGIDIDVELRASPPKIDSSQSLLASAFFGCFRPEALGELEFHTSRRIYARENVGSVNLRISDRSEQRRSRFLYDLENKYRNIKSQLLEEYVASLLRGKTPDEGPLQASLKELFGTFFPGKQFVGIRVDEAGVISFPVELDTGERHDIDELSSGEKEIVYGYLWLRTGTPKHSVILVDEPELHLNPALVQGLPDFYDRHLSQALGAQVWIVTHSDAILRQAVRSPNMAVYHMARPAGTGENQVIRIDTQDAVEAAVLDLIGDLAAYRPHAKIVLVEGAGPTSFDVDVIWRLFPDLSQRANFISAGSKSETIRIGARLQEVIREAGLTSRVLTITDRDLLDDPTDTVMTWPVYEIENFLLEPGLLRATLRALLRKDPLGDDQAVVRRLREVARSLVDRLALGEVQRVLNDEFMRAMSIGGSPASARDDLASSGTSSKERVGEIDTSPLRVENLLSEARQRLEETVESERFLQDFPGERLLTGFAGEFGLDGEIFRNACLDQAQQMRRRPPELERTLREILAD
jgi:ABC-type lipoprotein export system ATPase subunit